MRTIKTVVLSNTVNLCGRDYLYSFESPVKIPVGAGVTVEWENNIIHDCGAFPHKDCSPRTCHHIGGTWYVMEGYEGHPGLIDKLKHASHCPDCGIDLNDLSSAYEER